MIARSPMNQRFNPVYVYLFKSNFQRHYGSNGQIPILIRSKRLKKLDRLNRLCWIQWWCSFSSNSHFVNQFFFTVILNPQPSKFIFSNTDPFQTFKMATQTKSTTLNSMVLSDFTYLFIIYARRNEHRFKEGEIVTIAIMATVTSAIYRVTGPWWFSVIYVMRSVTKQPDVSVTKVGDVT
jgi:hypothetical protein